MPCHGFCQSKNIEKLNKENLNWYNKDKKLDHAIGTSVDKSYELLLKTLTPKKIVVVAVIDGGVDVNHIDLQGRIWTNTREIPGNGIDDDNNGFIDDVHGWNFIGNKSGENIENENYEYTRIVKLNNVQDSNFIKSKELYDNELSNRKREKFNLDQFESVYNNSLSIIKEKTGIEAQNINDLHKIKSKDDDVLYAKNFLQTKYKIGLSKSLLEALKKHNSDCLNYYLNLDFSPRTITGDDPLNIQDCDYGNNDVIGPESEHGTMCAGIIAAVRNNGIGIDGIASNVKIMALRTTPNGDERDKDIALAIIYAVDNGADIINMSFGKRFSPQKSFVDSAVRYAAEHHVLLIHAAGNESDDVDKNEYFPSPRFINHSEASNWLTVGATNKKEDKHLPAYFSNYGRSHVDVFAPGVDIISLDSMNSYNQASGTSFSAPVTTGIAALVLSYYPDLTPEQLVKILCESSYKSVKPRKVFLPSKTGVLKEKIKFNELSKSGGIANAYNALIMAGEIENRK